ncbi:chorismate mutase [Malassezia cuniculi]|uniref:Chorismate mutase n=1 Tax=Malassezia cuniculi TaxID=948313 RepID=A0AAF0EXU2_9BASI|nr:chorismate mutase [Malassezia cuniculi]
MPRQIPEGLQLPKIRATLQRMEETIVFYLIERGQFAHNPKIYEPGAFPELAEHEHWNKTWLEWVLKEVESSYAKLGRWHAPDEYPYTPIEELPAPVLTPMSHPKLLHPHHINVTSRIFDFYTKEIVPRITAREGNNVDYNYGSSAVCDCEVLSALSRRIHYGMFVSESKFLADPAAFIPHIRSRNTDALADLITKPEVEKILLRRIAQKSDVYGQDLDSAATAAGGVEKRRKINPDDVVTLYEKYVIPLTKVVEVDYLLERLDGLSDAEVEELCK